MSMDKKLLSRSGSKCELCSATDNLVVYNVPHALDGITDDSILICATCQTQMENPETMDPNHWRCLNDSMWSEVRAVQVVAWRMLNRLSAEGWPQDLLDMMYLDDETKKWAGAAGEEGMDENAIVHLDSNGSMLLSGDTVVLTKDLNVKGANFTAKRGTAVRNITLVHDNAEQIEGRVNGQHIVLLTQFVKKSN